MSKVAFFQDEKYIYQIENINRREKKRVFKCYKVKILLLYECKSWTLGRNAKKKYLMAVDMSCLREMQKISRTNRKTNERVLHEIAKYSTLISEIRRRP